MPPRARTRHLVRRRPLAVATTAAITLAVIVVSAVPVHANGPHTLPVAGAVVRGIDLLAGDYGPGHRGVDLRVAAGTEVRTSHAGTVTFAGQVAGYLWVSVDHGGALVTSYGPLARVVARRGEVLAARAVVGTSGGRDGGHDGTVLHWGARRSGRYIDPMTLLMAPQPRVATLAGPGGWQVTGMPDVPGYTPWEGEHSWGRVPESQAAVDRGWAYAPNPNHVIGVAGITSRTGEVPMRLDHLGFAPEDITYLSYFARAPMGDADDPWRDQWPYGPEDTLRGIEDAANKLHIQLQQQWQRHPDQAVDLVGHSMGGVVIAYYLLTMYDPSDPSLPPIDHVVTLASPLQGADLASAVLQAQRSPGGIAVIEEWMGRLAPGLDPTNQSLQDLAVGSDVIVAIAAAWAAAQEDPWSGPLALGTDLLTTGATHDYVVPENRSELDGAAHVVLPGDHTTVRYSEAALQVVQAFLADRVVPGEAGGIAHWASYGTSYLTQAIGLTVYENGGVLDLLTDAFAR